MPQLCQTSASSPLSARSWGRLWAALNASRCRRPWASDQGWCRLGELHAQKTRQMWDTLRYAGLLRRQPLHLSITTAGFDRYSICREQHDYAEKVLDGTIEDPSFLPFIAAAGAEGDWTDPDVWRKANPSFGVTISPEPFAEDSNSIFPMRRKAGKESPGVIDQPCLVVYGTAIPTHYCGALSERKFRKFPTPSRMPGLRSLSTSTRR